MASRMDYEIESPYKTDSPLSYDEEEGELSSPGSGRSSPRTIATSAQWKTKYLHNRRRLTSVHHKK